MSQPVPIYMLPSMRRRRRLGNALLFLAGWLIGLLSMAALTS